MTGERDALVKLKDEGIDCSDATAVTHRGFEDGTQHLRIRGLLQQFRATLTEQQGASVGDGWLPIESAPRDGTVVWAFNGEADRMKWICGDGYDLFIYADELLADVCPDPDQPTHWQPLPAAPMTAASGMDEGG